jgi:hypothetical protein
MHRFRVARPGSAKEKIPYFLCLLSRESKKNTAKIQKEGIVNIRIACVLAALCGTLQAQEATAPWKHSLAGAVNLSQVALKDWAQGGEDALAWALTLNGGSTYATDKVDWNNTDKLAFGQSKLGDQDVRKTDDKISLGTTLTYKVGTYLNPYVGATMKTQFAHG